MSTFNDTHFEFGAEVERIEGEIESLGEEIERIEGEIESLGEEIDGLEDDDGRAAVLAQQIQDLQAHRKGVIWARDQAYESDDFPAWDEDVSGVTLGAPRSGVHGELQDDLGKDPDVGEGTANNLIVADATVEAPYVGDDVGDGQAAAAVGSFHPYWVKWAKTRVEDLLDPESGNGTSSGTSPGGEPAETTPTDE